MSDTLKILDTDFAFIPTDKGLNYIICKEFKEVFFDIFEINCNGNKIIAEKVDDLSGDPVLKITTEYNSKLYSSLYVLKEGDDNIILNIKSLDNGKNVFTKEKEILESVAEEESLPDPQPVIEETYTVSESASVDIERYKADAIRVINENFSNKKHKIEQLQESLTNLIDERLSELKSSSITDIKSLKSDILQSFDEKINQVEIISDKAVTEANSIRENIEAVAELYTNIVTTNADEKTKQLQDLREGVIYDINTKIAELQTELVNQEAQVTNAFQSIQTFIDDSKKQLLEQKTTNVTDVETICNESKQIVTENLKRAENLISNKINKLQSTADKKINEITTFVENRISVVDDRIADINGAVERAESSLQEQISQGLNNILAEAKSHSAILEDKKVEIENIISKTANELSVLGSNIVESVEKKVKDFNLVAIKREDLNSLKKQLETRLENESANIKKVVASYGGGGSVATQYANGGTMNGSLNIATGQILSGGIDISTIFSSGGTATGAYLPLSGGTLSGALIIGNAESLTTSPSAYLTLRNTTTATSAVPVQVSPALVLEGRGWKTTATAASQSVRFRQSVLPIQGTTAPAGMLVFQSDIAGTNTWTNRLGIGFGSTVNGLYTETGGGVFFAGLAAGNQNNVGISGNGLAQLSMHCNGSITHGLFNNASQAHFVTTAGGALAFSSTSNVAGAVDIALTRDTNFALAQRVGINAQTNRIYNTFTDANNFERGFTRWRGSQFSATISGTTMTITVAAIGAFALGQKIVGTGVTVNTLVNTLSTGTLGAVGSTYTVSIAQTVATATVMNSYSDVFEIGTEKLGVGLSARPISFVTDGVDRWSITAGGSLLAAADITYDIGASGRRPRNIYCYDFFTGRSVYANDNVNLGNGAGGGDLIITSPLGVVQLRPGAAGTLYQRNGTAPQNFWLANTYTDTSNYERAVFGFTSNVLRIGTENLGTGVARAIDFVVGGTARWNISTAGHLLATADNTYDIGATGATRPRNIYAGTSGTFPTATIGGLFMSGSFSGLVFNNGWWTNGGDIRFGSTGRLTFASGSAPGNAADVILLRDAANTPALRNDTNPQTFNTYNTSTSANLTYERGFSRWRGSSFTATISGTLMTMTVAAVGTFALGQRIAGTGVTANTLVNTLLTGTLGAAGSTYTVSISQTVATATVINSYKDVFEIGTEKLGTGSARALSLMTDGVERINIGTTGEIIQNSKAAPASATDTGIAGEVRFDDNYIYRCTATNTWKRAALSTWP